MKISRTFFALPALLGWMCLSIALCPSRGYAQQTARSRPAAKPAASPAGRPAASPSPTAKPTPTPPIIPPVLGMPPPEAAELSPPSDANDAAPVSETEIDATDGATFASKDRIAVFKGNVRVTDPRFQLACDTLTVFLNKTTAADAPAVPAAVGGGASPSPGAGSTPPPLATPDSKAASNPPTAPGAKPATSPGGGGGIDHAEALGHVIILQKRAPTKPGEEEKVSIGRGDKGTFDNKTGDMVLYGMPEIEQNGNSHSATSPDTVMTIHKDSSLDTVGPSRTILIQHKGGGAGLELPGVPATAGPAKPKKNGNGARPAPSATP